MYYSYSDSQGSLIALVHDGGSVIQRFAYDPWGARRDPNDWTVKDSRTSFIINRGYTGHEHLDAFGIINMNGRVYDPLTAQFLSPDPFVQSPDNWVNYNRYGYCLNNPLIYSDPSGYVNTASSEFSGCVEQFWQYLADGNSYSQAVYASSGGGGGGGGRGGGSSAGHFENENNFSMVNTYSRNPDGTMTLLYSEINVYQTPVWISGSREDAMYNAAHPYDNLNNKEFKGGKGRGVIVSMINGTAAFGLGLTGDFGMVTDSYNNSILYLTVGYAMGLGASAGTGVNMTNNGFKSEEIGGEGVNASLTLPFLNGLITGDGFLGNGTHGIGLGLGIGAGYFISHTNTYTAPIPEFNDKYIYFSTYGH